MGKQGSIPRRRAVAAATVAGVLTLAVPAAADQQIVAAKSLRYANPSVTIQQGERLTFRNDDNVKHDVTATDSRDAQPLFQTPLVDPGAEVEVSGASRLKPGSYSFLCSVHPNMQGTLTVARAASTDDGAAVRPAAASLRAVRKAGRLTVRVRGAAGSDAIVAARATIKGKKVTLAKKRVTLDSDDAQKVALKLSDRGLRALRGLRTVTVTFKISVLAADGSRSASAKRTYR